MHRFKNIALIDGRECYKALNEFVTSLFPENHPMTKPSDLSIHEFIEYITEGFSFDGNNYCVSHSIERSKNNFFAVFFMTSHIYGLERILEVKWKEDEEFGKSFRLDTNSPQLSLFEKWDKEQNKTSNIQKLSNILLELMSTSNKLDNLVLYEETLKNGFLPKHSNQVLRELKKKNSIRILDSTTGEEINSTKALYNNWNTYKNHESKIIIEKT